MSSQLQIAANRQNAGQSTGPVSDTGKAVSSRNATRHGLRTDRVILEGEDPAAYEALTSDLTATLEPVGTVEIALVERIALCLWRQRRLVAAENAELEIETRPHAVLKALGQLDEPGVDWPPDPEDIEPFHENQREWCAAVVAKSETLEDFDLVDLQAEAPKIYAQLASDARDDRMSIVAFLDEREGGLPSYVAELAIWCQNQLLAAARRPAIMALASQLRDRRLILPNRHLDVISRYQTTLDNQLYKALRALREAQDWREQRSRTETDASD